MLRLIRRLGIYGPSLQTTRSTPGYRTQRVALLHRQSFRRLVLLHPRPLLSVRTFRIQRNTISSTRTPCPRFYSRRLATPTAHALVTWLPLTSPKDGCLAGQRFLVALWATLVCFFQVCSMHDTFRLGVRCATHGWVFNASAVHHHDHSFRSNLVHGPWLAPNCILQY